MLAQKELESEKYNDYKHRFENEILEVHRQYNIRSKKNNDKSNKNNFDNPVKNTIELNLKKTAKISKKNINSSEKKNTENVTKKTIDVSTKTTQTDIPSTSQQAGPVTKVVVERDDLSNLLKIQTPFNIENELAKLKIYIPLIELINKNMYRYQVLNVLNVIEITNIVNLNDDQPELLFGPEVDGKLQGGGVPPFYVSLNIHNKMLHNAMLDLGASHNLMPNTVMEKLGLEITRPYKYLYSFDCSKVRYLGPIKDLYVTLAQIPTKSLVMEMVVGG